jgi:hypothetical protein
MDAQNTVIDEVNDLIDREANARIEFLVDEQCGELKAQAEIKEFLLGLENDGSGITSLDVDDFISLAIIRQQLRTLRLEFPDGEYYSPLDHHMPEGVRNALKDEAAQRLRAWADAHINDMIDKYHATETDGMNLESTIECQILDNTIALLHDLTD